MFHKLKTVLRNADERSITAVEQRIGDLLHRVSAIDCASDLGNASV